MFCWLSEETLDTLLSRGCLVKTLISLYYSHVWMYFFSSCNTHVRGIPNSYFLLTCTFSRLTHYKPVHYKTDKMACAPSEDSDQPGHPPSLIRVFAVCLKKAWVLNYPLSVQQRLWSDLVDAQADLSLPWAHMPFCWFCHALAHVILYFQAIWS